MILYHGTNLLFDEIDLVYSRNRVDFGKGFYLTDKLGTAYNWAIRKVELEGEGTPTVLSYEIDSNIYTLHGLKFPHTPEFSWLEFICSNRQIAPSNNKKREPRHDFNWVTGLIADDKVVDVVAEYMRNEISDKEAIKRLKALPQTYQVSLHTSIAISYINEENVQYKQLKKGRWTQAWKKSEKPNPLLPLISSSPSYQNDNLINDLIDRGLL